MLFGSFSYLPLTSEQVPYLPLLPGFDEPAAEEADRSSEFDEDEEFDDEARPHAEDVCEESEPGPQD